MADNILRGFTNPEKHVNYNHFDQSYHNGYTCKIGQIIPCSCIELDPGDKIEVSVAAMARTMPLTTPTFLRAKLNYDYFFVPFSQLNRNWNSIFANVNEFGSAQDQNVFDQADIDLPYLPLASVLNNMKNTSTVYNIFGQDIRGDMSKLLDMLDYGSYRFYDASTTPGTHTYTLALPQFMSNSVPLDVNTFRLQAYQKIFNCYYRDHYYDPIDADAAQGYNTDDILMGTGNTPNIQSQRDTAAGTATFAKTVMNMLPIRYHRYKQDMFMGALPSRQDGVVSSISISNFQLINAIDATDSSLDTLAKRQGSKLGATKPSNSNNISTAIYDSSGNLVSGSSYWNIPNAFDVLTLRQAEALQRWKETTLRAGKSAKKQFKGHTGFVPKYMLENYPDFIGSFDTIVAVDEVISNSDTLTNNSGSIEGAQLGQLAGKGVSITGRNEFRYFARDHGLLMCCAYILPEIPYNNTGISPFNTKLKRSSYYMKEFENCGLVPVPRRELDISQVTTQAQMNSIIGYLPYGYEYKTNFDRVHGELQYNRSLEAWTPTRRDLIAVANAIPNAGGLNKSVRYINPAILNPIFAVNADPTEQTDQFVVNHYNDVKKLSDKTVLGLPQYH